MLVTQFRLIKLLVCHTTCWWDNLPFLVLWRTENDLSKNNWLCGVILILLVTNQYLLGGGFLFSIVLVPRYKSSLCHTKEIEATSALQKIIKSSAKHKWVISSLSQHQWHLKSECLAIWPNEPERTSITRTNK
jgi:hypothetical protein